MAPSNKKTTTTASAAGRKRKADVLEDDGAMHSSIRSSPGAVWVWGEGDCGQLGTGPDLESKYRPFPIMADTPCVQVACGGLHSVALTADGKVYTWGVNDDGALGRETDDDSATEADVVEGAIKGLKVVAVSAGDSHTLAMTADGAVYGWGTYRGAEGPWYFTLTSKVEKAPILVMPADKEDRLLKVVSGGNHTVALFRSGKVLTWGSGEQGQLGRVGERIGVQRKNAAFLVPAAVKLPGRLAGKPVDVFAGEFDTFIVTDADKVFACGLNNHGQLGLEPDEDAPCVYALTLVPLLCGLGVTEVHSGGHHSCAITKDAAVYCFGAANYGRLGVELTDEQHETGWAPPVKVTANFEGKVSKIACASQVSGAICGGNVYTWGSGVSHQHAMGDEDEDQLLPHKMKQTKRFQNQEVLDLSFGAQHTMILANPRD